MLINYPMIRQFYKLATKRQHITTNIKKLYQRLRLRGYPTEYLASKFTKAINKLEQDPPKKTKITMDDTLFLHLKYHPADPQKKQIQKIFNKHLFNPPKSPSFAHLQNKKGGYLESEILLIYYHRQKKLKNLLFPRKVKYLMALTMLKYLNNEQKDFQSTARLPGNPTNILL